MASQSRCPKCGGNLFETEDIYSRFMSCLQCGGTREITKLGSLDETLAAALGPHRARLGLGAARD